jgi:hypothetical protein
MQSMREIALIPQDLAEIAVGTDPAAANSPNSNLAGIRKQRRYYY